MRSFCLFQNVFNEAFGAVGSEFICHTASITPHDVIAVAGVSVVSIEFGLNGLQYKNVFPVIVTVHNPTDVEATPEIVQIFTFPPVQEIVLYDEDEKTISVEKSSTLHPEVSIQLLPSHVFSVDHSLHIDCLLGSFGCVSVIDTCEFFNSCICRLNSMTCCSSRDIILLLISS